MKLNFTILYFLTFFLLNSALYGQCNIFQNQSTGSGSGSCNSHDFKFTIGSLSTVFGNCDGLFFTPVLTGGDINTSIEEVTSETIKIFPNPFRDVLNIELPESKILNIEIFNGMGQLVYSQNYLYEHYITLKNQQFTPGVYVVKFNFDTDKTIIKTIVNTR